MQSARTGLGVLEFFSLFEHHLHIGSLEAYLTLPPVNVIGRIWVVIDGQSRELMNSC